MTKLSFQLEVEDGWPPVAAEVMECTQVDKSFRIESAPLFLKGLSVGDLIIATPDEEGRVWEWQHLAKSDRTTIWLARLSLEAQGEIDATLLKLRGLKCNVTRSEALGCFAIDVPADCPIDDVDRCLAPLAPDRVAVAFPSFRHEEGETEG